MPIVLQLLTATALVTMTVAMHLAGLAGLLSIIRTPSSKEPNAPRREIVAITVAAVCLFALHGAEIWTYAAFYEAVGALPDFEAALYFSTATYTTIGYGDVVLAKSWRLVGAIEGANGIILLGWSTAFFVAIVGRITFVERELGRQR